MNNKSRIALAIAAAFGTAALGVSSGAIAQTSTVQIGGGINLKYVNHRNTGGAVSGSKNSNNDHLSLQEPEMWIHGEEKIGGNTAWFRCSSSFDILGAGGGTQATPAGTVAAPSTSQLCGRNSALGFKGNFGNIYFGNWDSPTKNVSGPVRGWFSSTDSLVGGFGNVILNTSSSNTTNVNATQASWTERRQRQIRYDSPTMSGFTVSGAYTAANESTALSTAALQGLTPRFAAFSVDYTNGPLFVGIAHERHMDHNPGAIGNGSVGTVNAAGTAFTAAVASTVGNGAAGSYNGGTDKNWMFGVGYTFGFGMKLSALYNRSSYEVTDTTNLKKNGWAVFMDYKVSGPHVLKANYFVGGDSKGNSTVAVGAHQAPGANTGAKGYNLGYMYEMSKRTSIGAMYSVIDNEVAAKYAKGIQGATLGQTQKVYGLYTKHSF